MAEPITTPQVMKSLIASTSPTSPDLVDPNATMSPILLSSLSLSLSENAVNTSLWSLQESTPSGKFDFPPTRTLDFEGESYAHDCNNQLSRNSGWPFFRNIEKTSPGATSSCIIGHAQTQHGYTRHEPEVSSVSINSFGHTISTVGGDIVVQALDADLHMNVEEHSSQSAMTSNPERKNVHPDSLCVNTLTAPTRLSPDPTSQFHTLSCGTGQLPTLKVSTQDASDVIMTNNLETQNTKNHAYTTCTHPEIAPRTNLHGDSKDHEGVMSHSSSPPVSTRHIFDLTIGNDSDRSNFASHSITEDERQNHVVSIPGPPEQKRFHKGMPSSQSGLQRTNRIGDLSYISYNTPTNSERLRYPHIHHPLSSNIQPSSRFHPQLLYRNTFTQGLLPHTMSTSDAVAEPQMTCLSARQEKLVEVQGEVETRRERVKRVNENVMKREAARTEIAVPVEVKAIPRYDTSPLLAGMAERHFLTKLIQAIASYQSGDNEEAYEFLVSTQDIKIDEEKEPEFVWLRHEFMDDGCEGCEWMQVHGLHAGWE